MTSATRVRTGFVVLRTVAIAVTVAVGGLMVVRGLVAPADSSETNDFVGNYLQALASIYAVLLAFVTFVVWSQFNDARTLVEREANELLDLFRTARALPEPVGGPLCKNVAGYVEEVLGAEWQAMACAAPGEMRRGTELLDVLWGRIASVAPGNERESALFAELLSRFNDLSDVRQARLTASRLRIPMALKIFVYAGAFMTVGSLYLVCIPSFTVHAIATGAVAGALSNVLYVIHDLDSCFSGEWQVPRSAFERVAAYVHKCSGAGSV
jgi:hypothetical protein